MNCVLGAAPPEAYFLDDTNRTWEKISREARWAVGIAGAVWWNFRLADGLVTVALCNRGALYFCHVVSFYLLLFVHGQVTIIFVVSVCLSVCLCSFSQPSLIRFRSN